MVEPVSMYMSGPPMIVVMGSVCCHKQNYFPIYFQIKFSSTHPRQTAPWNTRPEATFQSRENGLPD